MEEESQNSKSDHVDESPSQKASFKTQESASEKQYSCREFEWVRRESENDNRDQKSCVFNFGQCFVSLFGGQPQQKLGERADIGSETSGRSRKSQIPTNDILLALESGRIKAKVNKSEEFHCLRVKRNRLHVENDSSEPYIVRPSDLVQVLRSKKSSHLFLYVNESQSKVAVIQLEFEGMHEMDLFCRWIKKGWNSAKRREKRDFSDETEK